MHRFTNIYKDNFSVDTGITFNQDIEIQEPDKYIGVNKIEGYDIPAFFDDLNDFFTELQKTTGEFKNFSIKPAFSYDSQSKDEGNMIRYEVALRTPASMSSNQGHSGRLNYNWMLTDEFDDSLNPGYRVYVYSKHFDNTVMITSWSKNHRDADEAAFAIEGYMESYGKKIFQNKGLLQLRYEGRLADKTREVGNVMQFGIPLEFYVRTNRVRLVYEKILESLQIKFNVLTK